MREGLVSSTELTVDLPREVNIAVPLAVGYPMSHHHDIMKTA